MCIIYTSLNPLYENRLENALALQKSTRKTAGGREKLMYNSVCVWVFVTEDKIRMVSRFLHLIGLPAIQTLHWVLISDRNVAKGHTHTYT